MSATLPRSQLRTEIESKLLGSKFTSLATIRKIVSKESVHNYFIQNGITLQPETVSKIGNNAPKLFCLLVLRERGVCVTEYLSAGIRDNAFPFEREEDIPLVGTLEEREHIYHWQWKIPPILEKSKHMDFPLGFMAPFVEEEKISHGALTIYTFDSLASAGPAPAGVLRGSPFIVSSSNSTILSTPENASIRGRV